MQLQRPVKWQEKTDWRLTQKFGERPEVYKPIWFKAHPWIDYAWPKPWDIIDIYSAVDWYCERLLNPKGYGIYIKQIYEYEWVKYEIIYWHLSKVLKTGAVKKGEKIAVMGTTGNSTGVHLHFEIKDPRKMQNWYQWRIDPLPFVTDWEVQIIEKQMPIQELYNIWMQNVKPEQRKFQDYTFDWRIKYLVDLWTK